MTDISKAEWTIDRICSIPRDYRSRGNVSLIRLFEESGYRDHAASVTNELLVAYAKAHPEIIRDWSGYSGDKRCGSGWYFEASKREVGYYSGEGISGREFPTDAEAVAFFILCEMDHFMKVR